MSVKKRPHREFSGLITETSLFMTELDSTGKTISALMDCRVQCMYRVGHNAVVHSTCMLCYLHLITFFCRTSGKKETLKNLRRSTKEFANVTFKHVM